MIEPYTTLMDRYKDLYLLGSTGSILAWDMETKMPPKGIALRSEQLALLQKTLHHMLTDPENGRLIKQAADHPDLTPLQRRNLHLANKEYQEATCLPEELVVDTARQTALTIDAWKKAKAAKDYPAFRPYLEKIYELKLRAGELLMEPKGSDTPHDALIDVSDPGVTAHQLTRLFDEMKSGLIPLIRKCVDSDSQPDTGFLKRKIPIDTQRKITDALAQAIGYDITSPQAGGRIDETEHPFTTGYYDDVRVTTHYHEDKFDSNIFAILHEGGHALYEQNLPREWIYQPVGTACSSGLHESQSRFIENIVGRSPEFWTSFYPKLREITGDALADVTPELFVHAVNLVKPSKIRIEADELTYGLHIIIRFEIERDLFAGKTTVDELPQIWNDKYASYLGVEIEDDSEGVMQDTHWAGGAFGTFQSYALGNIYGGMMLEKLNADLPDWRSQLSKGSLNEVKAWLKENVHRRGNLYDAPELIKKITGKTLTVTPFIEYLETKYSKFYSL